MVVVHHRVGFKFRPRPRCCHQGKHHTAGLGLYRRAHSRNGHRPVGE